MYTKCPSCGAGLHFSPPSNWESLPETYEHRFKCLRCGVTICVTKKDATQLPDGDDCIPSTVASVATVNEKYIVDAPKSNKSKRDEYNGKKDEYEQAYDEYVDLLAEKMENGGSTARNFAIVLKTILIILFVCMCLVVVTAIAAFVLHMLEANDKVALSTAFDPLIKFYGIYGPVALVVGIFLFWPMACIHVGKKSEVVSNREIARAKREWKRSKRALEKYISQFETTDRSPYNLKNEKPPKSAAISRRYKNYPKSKPNIDDVRARIAAMQNKKPNLLDKLSAKIDDFVGRGSISNSSSSSSKWCGKCRWYEAGDAQGYVPGYCRRHSQTALWGDDACGDYE